MCDKSVVLGIAVTLELPGEPGPVNPDALPGRTAEGACVSVSVIGKEAVSSAGFFLIPLIIPTMATMTKTRMPTPATRITLGFREDTIGTGGFGVGADAGETSMSNTPRFSEGRK